MRISSLEARRSMHRATPRPVGEQGAEVSANTRGGGRAPRDAYGGTWVRWRRNRPARLLCSLAASLALVLAAVHVPTVNDEPIDAQAPVRVDESIPLELIQLVPAPRVEAEPAAVTDGDGAEATKADWPETIDYETPAFSDRTIPDVRGEGPGEGGLLERVALHALAAVLQPLAPDVTEATLTARAVERPVHLAVEMISPPRVEQPPTLRLETIDVHYPADARRARIEGRVILRFMVEPDGRAYGIQVVQSLFPSCDDAAIRAVQAARFVPGYESGRAVPAQTMLAIRFVLYG